MSGAGSAIVEAEEAGLRLDRWFKRHYPHLSHGQLEKLIRTGQVRLDGGRVKAGVRLQAGQRIRIPPHLDEMARPAPSRPPLTADDISFVRALVLYRDDDVIVLDKPSGLAVQGGSKTPRHLDGLLEALRFEAAERPRLVHRLDRDTSGVLLLARSARAAAHLTKAFKGRAVRKTYWGLCLGVPRPVRGRIDLPLEKRAAAASGRERMAPASEESATALRAETDYVVVAQAAHKLAWLALRPLTGRTHQLRAHCAAIGHPLLGDVKYGGPAAANPFVRSASPCRLHLHARRLQLILPSGRPLDVTAPLPPHMAETWDFFEFDRAYAQDPFAEFGQ